MPPLLPLRAPRASLVDRVNARRSYGEAAGRAAGVVAGRRGGVDGFEIEARFPESIEEFPQPAVEYVAGLVKVPAGELAKYDLAGAKRHRKQG